jgi:diaminohydroxyphosphoribosylaminopyrimidine deaminase/5-amino-6-(5-phosphoribosylamino)uracil reductase
LHHGPGTAHAEPLAVQVAGQAARGATAYVNLEPCAHHGRTPPCTDALIQAGVAHVIASTIDPDPRVNGRGLAALETAGIRTACGLLERAARDLNAAFFRHHESGRPMVTLKAAISVDGLLSAANGEARWISSPTSRRVAHRLRLDHDVVLVGAGTIRRDDPRLTVRLDGTESRRRVAILSSSLRLPREARVFQGAKVDDVLIYTAPDATDEDGLGERATIIPVPVSPSGLALDAVLQDLGRRGAYSVLVEGGGRTLHGFVAARLAQRAAWFQAPLALGARAGTPMLDGRAVDSPRSGWRFSRDGVFALEADQWTVGRWEEEV